MRDLDNAIRFSDPSWEHGKNSIGRRQEPAKPEETLEIPESIILGED